MAGIPHARTASADNIGGAAAMLTSVLLFAVMESLVKWLAADYPIHQIVFFRSALALVPCTVFVMQAGGLRALRTGRPHIHAFRGLTGLAAMGCCFYAVANMNLADAKAILFAGPLFLTALSVPLLGEKVGIYRWSAVIVGFVGIIVIVRPDGDVLNAAALAALAGAVLYALAMITIRHLSATESVASIAFYFSLTGAVAGALLVAALGWVTPTPVDLALLTATGLIGGVGQFFMTKAFRLGEAALMAPLDYTSMAWAILFGFLIWHELPAPNVFTGIAIVVASGLFILYRERQVARSRGTQLPKLRLR